jgi:hypothetical protein
VQFTNEVVLELCPTVLLENIQKQLIKYTSFIYAQTHTLITREEFPEVYVSILGTPYTQQSYKVSESFPFKWINKKWKEGFHVTSMATAGSRWAVVMSRNSGFSDQVLLIANAIFPIQTALNMLVGLCEY